jgi:hypothetical protein
VQSRPRKEEGKSGSKGIQINNNELQRNIGDHREEQGGKEERDGVTAKESANKTKTKFKAGKKP